MQTFENKRFLNISEAAEYSGVSRSTIEYWLSIGLKCYEFPGRGNGRKRFRRIDRSELDCFLDNYCICQKQDYRNDEIDYSCVETTLLPREKTSGRGRVE